MSAGNDLPGDKKTSHPRKLRKPKDRDEWLKLRHHGIGSSDVGAVIGLNTFKSPYQLYLEKFSDTPVDREPSFAMKFGLMVEDEIARYYAKITGNRIRRDNYIRFHAEYPFLLANLDRLITHDVKGQPFPNGHGILEVKTAGEHAAAAWKDDVPLYYYSQVQHQLAVTDLQWAAIIVVIGNRDCRIVPIVRDEAFIAEQVKVCVRFWQEHVKQQVPPKWTFQDLDLIYAKPGKEVAVPSGMIPTVLMAFEAKRRESEAKKEYAALKDEICLYMGECDGLTINGTLAATWRETKPSPAFDEDEFKVAHPDLYQQFVKTPERGSRKFLLSQKALPTLTQECERIKLLPQPQEA